MLQMGEKILKDFIDKNGEVHLNKEGVEHLSLIIDFKLDTIAKSRMSCDLRDYIQSAKDDEQHTYTDDVIDEHFEYFADCWSRGLSAYKANCFFHFHLEEQKEK